MILKIKNHLINQSKNQHPESNYIIQKYLKNHKKIKIILNNQSKVFQEHRLFILKEKKLYFKIIEVSAQKEMKNQILLG